MHHVQLVQELTNLVKNNDLEWCKRHEELVAQATRHVNFCCGLYRYQLKRGKHFIREHPWSVRSWNIDGIKELMKDPRVSVACANMCQFGMSTHIDLRDGARDPVAKPTGFMTSSWTVYEELNKKCRDTHIHVPLVGGRASACQGNQFYQMSASDSMNVCYL